MSTIKVNTIKDTSGTEVYTAKAWVNFNGTGTVAIRAAGNVSSITDNGAGNYTVNFTTAMPDANYSAVTSMDQGSSGAGIDRITSLTINSVQIQNWVGGVASDCAIVTLAIFR